MRVRVIGTLQLFHLLAVARRSGLCWLPVTSEIERCNRREVLWER